MHACVRLCVCVENGERLQGRPARCTVSGRCKGMDVAEFE